MRGRVRCSQLHGAQVVLVGDAAHAVTPVGGQGANAALQDCEVLDHMLGEYGVPPPGAERCCSWLVAGAERKANLAITVSCFSTLFTGLHGCVQAYAQPLLPWIAQVPACVTRSLVRLCPFSTMRAQGPGVSAQAVTWRLRRSAGRRCAAPDAQALADIEAAFYKLVGGRKLGFLDPGFLRLIAHIALGAPACSHKTPHGHWVCGRAEGLRATVQIFRLRAVQVNLEGRLLDRCFGFCEVDCQRHGACKSPGRMSSFAAEEVHSVAVAGHWGGRSKH